jgi:hypothetical protein
MSKPCKKNRAPRRILALPDLEQSKAAVLNSLTSKSGRVVTIAPSLTSSSGTAQSRGWHSTAPWFCGTGSFSNRSHTHPQPSTSGWRRSDELRLKLLTPVSSVRNWQPEFDE